MCKQCEDYNRKSKKRHDPLKDRFVMFQGVENSKYGFCLLHGVITVKGQCSQCKEMESVRETD